MQGKANRQKTSKLPTIYFNDEGNPSLSPPKLEDKKKGKEKAKEESKTPLNDEDKEDGSNDTATAAAVSKTSKGASSTRGIIHTNSLHNTQLFSDKPRRFLQHLLNSSANFAFMPSPVFSEKKLAHLSFHFCLQPFSLSLNLYQLSIFLCTTWLCLSLCNTPAKQWLP